MKKLFFWILLLLGLFFLIGTIGAVLSYTAKITDKITIGVIPYALVGILLDFATNPVGWLGVVLLVCAYIIKKKIKA